MDFSNVMDTITRFSPSIDFTVLVVVTLVMVAVDVVFAVMSLLCW